MHNSQNYEITAATYAFLNKISGLKSKVQKTIKNSLFAKSTEKLEAT